MKKKKNLPTSGANSIAAPLSSQVGDRPRPTPATEAATHLDSGDGGRPSLVAILSMKPPSPTPQTSLIVLPRAAAAMVDIPMAMPIVMSMYSPAYQNGAGKVGCGTLSHVVQIINHDSMI